MFRAFAQVLMLAVCLICISIGLNDHVRAAMADDSGSTSPSIKPTSSQRIEQNTATLTALERAKLALISHLSNDAQLTAGGGPCAGSAISLLFPLDATFTLVDFCGDGSTGSGPAVCPDQHNDDDSATVPLGFTFDLYGDTFTLAFVNNNGNISFDTPFSAFTATGFPSGQFRMVAPFWADADTGHGPPAPNPIGDVWMKQYDSNGDTILDTLIVTWENVGYFNEHADRLNTYQVAISNGTNPSMGLGNNVCFSWDNMCWTTGDASGGAGGLGGTPATVGANRGNGIDYFQIGRFDHDAFDYDGPFGLNDGVSYLDGKTTCFSTAVISNLDPIPQNFPPGNHVTLDVSMGDTLSQMVSFISPEQLQTVTVAVTDPDGAQGAGLTISNNSPQIELVSLSLNWTPDAGDVGNYVLSFAASDDFNPPGMTNIDLTIEVINTGCPCNGDVNGSGSINLDDILYVLTCMCSGSPGFNCDVNCDGVEDGTDLGAIMCQWGGLDPTCCSGTVGRCCTAAFGCVVSRASTCAFFNGTYAGDGTTCPSSQTDCDGNGVPDSCEPDGNCDGIPDACVCACNGDIDGNGPVNQFDLLAVANCIDCIGQPNPACDVNCDGVVNVLDFGDEQCLQFLPPEQCCSLPHGACTNTHLSQDCIMVPQGFCEMVLSATYNGDGSVCPIGGFDCNGNLIGDACEAQCDDAADCTSYPPGSDPACICPQCLCGVCYYQPREANDANCDCIPANLDDLLCVLSGFASYPACVGGDVFTHVDPMVCGPDLVINIDDILRVLETFAGQGPCAVHVCGLACPQGACCYGAVCDIDSSGNCTRNGGHYKGDQVLCSPQNPCP